jgi:uncharacterized protein YbjT (DUF2867 family)
MKVLLFGATGMVGQGVLRECLLAGDVTAVVSVGRGAVPITHPKLEQIVQADLASLAAHESALRGFDACFFCLGVSSAGMTEAAYHRLTYDLTLAVAQALAPLNPDMVFTYVSGAGTDSSERGPSMWARVKGKTENALLRLPFKAVYLLRPGMIQAKHGARSKTPLYRWTYLAFMPVMPLLRAAMPNQVATTETMGQAMLNAVRRGAPQAVLEPADIERLSRPA